MTETIFNKPTWFQILKNLLKVILGDNKVGHQSLQKQYQYIKDG